MVTSETDDMMQRVIGTNETDAYEFFDQPYPKTILDYSVSD